MPSQNALNLFDQTYRNWKNLNLSAIYKEQLGTASFKYFDPEIKALDDKIEKVNLIKNDLSNSLLEKVTNHFGSIIDRLNTLANSNETKFINEKSNIEIQIRREIEWIIESWPQVLSLLTAKAQNADLINELLNQIKNLSEKSTKDASEIEELKNRLGKELEDFEERFKKTHLKRELITQQDIFSIHAENNKKIAKRWLLSIIGSSAIFLFILWLLLKDFCFDLNCFERVGDINYESTCSGCNKTVFYLEIFKSIAYRLLLISFFIYVISFCVRNYNAIMHNYTVNSHKANSLNAALVLLERARTPEGNDNIMNQAANAIFSHQPTGYSSKDPKNLNQTITEKVIEKINPISKQTT